MAILALRAKATATVGTPPFYNMYHVSCDNADVADVVNALPDIFSTFYGSIITYFAKDTEWTLFDSVEDIESVPPVIYSPTPKTQASTSSNTNTAPQVCGLISWRTAFAGRSYRGRSYIGPLNSAALNTDVFNPTFVTDLQTAAEQLLADISAIPVSATPSLVIYSRLDPGRQPPAVTGALVGNVARTQRRRN